AAAPPAAMMVPTRNQRHPLLLLDSVSAADSVTPVGARGGTDPPSAGLGALAAWPTATGFRRMTTVCTVSGATARMRVCGSWPGARTSTSADPTLTVYGAAIGKVPTSL